jgi:hypothetical protein
MVPDQIAGLILQIDRLGKAKCRRAIVEVAQGLKNRDTV